MGMVEEWRARPRPCKARQKKQKGRERRQHETPPHPKGNITVFDASENARNRSAVLGATGRDMSECMAAWETKTHITKSRWREICEQTLVEPQI